MIKVLTRFAQYFGIRLAKYSDNYPAQYADNYPVQCYDNLDPSLVLVGIAVPLYLHILTTQNTIKSKSD